MKISQTAENAILALGGEKIWKESKFIEAIVSVKGLAFILKGRPFYDKAFIRMEIEHPNSEITPIGAAPGITGVLKNEDVYLRNTKGEVIAERKKARTFFQEVKDFFDGMTSIWHILPIMPFGIISPYPDCFLGKI